MMNQSELESKKLKTDTLSRETTLGEGQVEETPSTAQGRPLSTPPDASSSGNDADGVDNDDDFRPTHPSDPGAHKPPGAAGYAHLAEFMTMTQYGMVRKHKDLSLLNLLYLQAEIAQLRAEWDEEVAADTCEVEGERRAWDYHWAAMASGSRRGVEGGRRWEVWERLRARLYEYYEAIQKHERLCDLPTPSNDQRKFISEYIVSDDLNGGRCVFLSAELRGEDPEAYQEKWLEDLVVFEHGPETYDGFARWIVMPVLKAAHWIWIGKGKKPSQADLETGISSDGQVANEKWNINPTTLEPLYQCNKTGYTILNRTLNAIMIILIPCAAIVSLNAVPDTNTRVGMVCGFSLVCAVGMAICSGAKRIEVFAVLAAFMSVQLVFVGQQTGPVG